MKLLYEGWRKFLSEAEVEEGINQITNQHDGRYYAFDWDDNLLFMPTEIYFNVVEDGTTTEVGVSTHKFAEIRELIGKPGKYENYQFTEGSFRDFRVEGNLQFLKDVSSGPPVAEAWPDFVEAINTASIFAIITARGHSPETLKRGAKQLIRMNYQGIDRSKLKKNLKRYADIVKRPVMSIDDYLDMCRFYPVSYGIKDGAAKPEQLKVSAMNNFENYVNNLNQKLGINATPYVEIEFSDDDIKNFDLMTSVFPNIKTKYTGPKRD